MNNPRPLTPLSPLSQPTKSRSTIGIVFVLIIAVHAVFFTGLLLQGCKQKNPETAGGAPNATTNAETAGLTNPYPELTNAAAGGTQQVAQGQPALPPPTNVAPVEPATPPAPVAAPAGEYVVVKGDFPAKIAREHGVSLQALMKANPDLNPRKLKVGQKLVLPASTSTSASAPASTAGTGAVTGESAGVYVVKSGDNLTRIAKHYGVSVKALRAANSLKTDRIHVGQKLNLPPGKTAAPAPDNAGLGAPAAQPTLTASNASVPATRAH